MELDTLIITLIFTIILTILSYITQLIGVGILGRWRRSNTISPAAIRNDTIREGINVTLNQDMWNSC